MPICKKCKNKWSWKQTIKKTTTLFPEMTCPHCGEVQYQSKQSKRKAPMVTLIALLPLLIQAFVDLPAAIILSAIPAFAIISLLLYPYLVELSNEEEYPF